MNILSIILTVLFGAIIVLFFWFLSNFLWDDEGSTLVKVLGFVVAVPILYLGFMDAFGLLEEHYNITLKFLDTGNIVCYEDARIVYGKNSQKTLVTSDGQRITIVNAEVTVEKVEE